MSEEKHKHWSEWLADKVIEEKKEPYVITGGMTTSGPLHFGTLCEFLFPDTIRRVIAAKGKKVEFYFIADIFDAFDSVPLDMERYRAQLEPHLGKPLCDVPDPTGMSQSFGDHYLDEARALVKLFDMDCHIVRINEYYRDGKFDQYAKFFLSHEAETKKIVEETSGKQEKKDWSPIQPVCSNCGRIATTRVISNNANEMQIEKYAAGQVPQDSDVIYQYACDKDVKYTRGCGYRGSDAISNHRYKLVWRLHWPVWKQIFNSSIEGAGVDHHTKGGSEDTCKAITKELLKADYHIPYKYGFILFQGKKYSKSKGTGMGIREIVKLAPPEVIRYMLLRPDLEENIDIDPTSENLLKTIEDFESASRLEIAKADEANRSDRKRSIAFSLSTDKLHWKSFLDLLLYYQIYQDWGDVAAKTGDAEGAKYLGKYIEEWIRRDFIPQDYNFKYQPTKDSPAHVKKYISTLELGMDALAIHNSVFEFAKSNGIEPKQMFADLYTALLGKVKGPRMGKLIEAIGIERVKKDILA